MKDLWNAETFDEDSAEGTSLLASLRRAASAIEMCGEEVGDDLKMMIDLAEKARREDKVRLAGVEVGKLAVEELVREANDKNEEVEEVATASAKRRANRVPKGEPGSHEAGGVWL